MASRLSVGLIAMLALAGCSSAQKARLAEREKISATSGMLCDFVNGDEYQDVEIQLNLEMARRCDSSKSFTVTEYKNASEVHGIVFCCSMRKDAKGAAKEHGDHESEQIDSKPEPKAAPAPKKEEKKPDSAKADSKKSALSEPSPGASSGPAPASVSAPSPQPTPSQPAPPKPQPQAQPGSVKSDMDAVLED